MMNPNNSEYIGTWSNTNEHLYNRTNVTQKDWEFSYYNTKEFTEDDHLIYDAYMKRF